MLRRSCGYFDLVEGAQNEVMKLRRDIGLLEKKIDVVPFYVKVILLVVVLLSMWMYNHMAT